MLVIDILIWHSVAVFRVTGTIFFVAIIVCIDYNDIK